jgi:hypothetical protein
MLMLAVVAAFIARDIVATTPSVATTAESASRPLVGFG